MEILNYIIFDPEMLLITGSIFTGIGLFVLASKYKSLNKILIEKDKEIKKLEEKIKELTLEVDDPILLPQEVIVLIVDCLSKLKEFDHLLSVLIYPSVNLIDLLLYLIFILPHSLLAPPRVL